MLHIPPPQPPPTSFLYSLTKHSSVAAPDLVVVDLGKILDFSSPTYAQGPTAFFMAFRWKMRCEALVPIPRWAGEHLRDYLQRQVATPPQFNQTRISMARSS